MRSQELGVRRGSCGSRDSCCQRTRHAVSLHFSRRVSWDEIPSAVDYSLRLLLRKIHLPQRGRQADAFRKFVQTAGLRWKAIPPSAPEGRIHLPLYKGGIPLRQNRKRFRHLSFQERLTDETTKFTCKIDFKEAATLLASPERRGARRAERFNPSAKLITKDVCEPSLAVSSPLRWKAIPPSSHRKEKKQATILSYLPLIKIDEAISF